MTLRTRPSTRSRRSLTRQQRSASRRPAGTLVDHRSELRSRTAVPKSPSQFKPARQPLPARPFGESPVTRPEHSFGRRLGSKQITSYRGRRVVHEKADSNTVRFVVLLSVFLTVGVAISVWLSGIATQQSFELNRLAQRDTSLSRELETANRDLEELRSGAEIARHAVTEQRPANPAESRPLTDVNDAPVRSSRASSSPESTDEISDSVVQVPQEASTPMLRSNAGLAPYDPNER